MISQLTFVAFSLSIASAFSQTTNAPPRFAVASIKVIPAAPPGPDTPPQSIIANPGTLIMRGMSFRSILTWAYDLKTYQVSCPEWMGTPASHGEFARYEIIAKAADPAPVSQLKAMLKVLLAERFKLVVHNATSQVPLYELALVKRGAALHNSDSLQEQGAASIHGSAYYWKNTAMDNFAEFVAGPMGAPVLDKTGLAGRFDFTIDLSTYQAAGSAFVWRDAFEDAMLRQLGLKLVRRNGPIEMLVVDGADKIPTEN